MKESTNGLTFEMIKAMRPDARELTLGRAKAIRWTENGHDCSISDFSEVSAAEFSGIKEMAFGMNDVQFVGRFRFARTHNGGRDWRD